MFQNIFSGDPKYILSYEKRKVNKFQKLSRADCFAWLKAKEARLAASLLSFRKGK